MAYGINIFKLRNKKNKNRLLESNYIDDQHSREGNGATDNQMEEKLVDIFLTKTEAEVGRPKGKFYILTKNLALRHFDLTCGNNNMRIIMLKIQKVDIHIKLLKKEHQ